MSICKNCETATSSKVSAYLKGAQEDLEKLQHLIWEATNDYAVHGEKLGDMGYVKHSIGGIADFTSAMSSKATKAQSEINDSLMESPVKTGRKFTVSVTSGKEAGKTYLVKASSIEDAIIEALGDVPFKKTGKGLHAEYYIKGYGYVVVQSGHYTGSGFMP